jgi:hypothetical protein
MGGRGGCLSVERAEVEVGRFPEGCWAAHGGIFWERARYECRDEARLSDPVVADDDDADRLVQIWHHLPLIDPVKITCFQNARFRLSKNKKTRERALRVRSRKFGVMSCGGASAWMDMWSKAAEA